MRYSLTLTLQSALVKLGNLTRSSWPTAGSAVLRLGLIEWKENWPYMPWVGVSRILVVLRYGFKINVSAFSYSIMRSTHVRQVWSGSVLERGSWNRLDYLIQMQIRNLFSRPSSANLDWDRLKITNQQAFKLI